MKIEKKSSNVEFCYRKINVFERARDAFQFYLEHCVEVKEPVVLLPSFVGWSANEGSGVVDPILAAKGRPKFYKLDADLQIDLAYLQETINKERPNVVTVIHYFGRPDPNLQKVADICRKNGVHLVEDEAHAMLTDLVSGFCGRVGDASLFSFHKMLPFNSGGALILNRKLEQCLESKLKKISSRIVEEINWFDYDLKNIAALRKRNQEIIKDEIRKLEGIAKPLWKNIDEQVVLQTYPIVLERGNRDLVYKQMNERGFGVVSLYHTLVQNIPVEKFPECQKLSRSILNLPVHQDLNPLDLPVLIDTLLKLLENA
jgi:dTDP-4-amino-4,6-dideoxygalactose transaminase